MGKARCFLIRVTGALLFASPAPATAAPPAGQIALTFDDLPALTILDDQAYVTYLNAVILRGLRAHHFPATGFVNESKLDDLDRAKQIAVLRAWLDAGMDLGNHTFSHDDPDELGAKGYTEDIAKGEAVTKVLLAEHHKRERWFRHPYLKTGSTAAAKATIDDWLAHHGYRIAPITMDADDWEFAEPYDFAISHHDVPMAAHIKSEYLGHTEAMIHWYRRASQALFHRDIPYVILLHTDATERGQLRRPGRDAEAQPVEAGQSGSSDGRSRLSHARPLRRTGGHRLDGTLGAATAPAAAKGGQERSSRRHRGGVRPCR